LNNLTATPPALFYDGNGNGKAAAVQIAVLDGNSALTYADVFIF
jgi:hypothetical protein